MSSIFIVSHFAAGLHYLYYRHELIVPRFWDLQVLALFCLSAGAALLVPWLCAKGPILFMLSLQYGALLLIGYPENDAFGSVAPLLILLVLETNIFLPVTPGIVYTFIMITLLRFGFPGKEPVQEYEIFFVDKRLIQTLFVFIIFVLGQILRHAIEISLHQKSLIDRLNKSVHQLTASNMEFQEYATAAEIESVIGERKRISRDIHDTIGYTLMNMIMMMEAASDLVPQESWELKGILAQTRDQAQMGLQETRRALRALRSTQEEKLRGLNAIQKLITVFQKVTGVHVQIEYGNLPFSVSDQIDIFLYRMVQECLTNAFRHGKATRILILLWIDDHGILNVRIRDNGTGTGGEIKEGLGLTGMRERISKINGTLEAKNVFDGFELAARMPIQ